MTYIVLIQVISIFLVITPGRLREILVASLVASIFPHVLVPGFLLYHCGDIKWNMKITSMTHNILQ